MTYEPVSEDALHGGTQKRYRFLNGYEASVVRHQYSYGFQDGLWELAVMDGDGLTYATPITDDVIGHLTDDEVETLLAQIDALPPARSPVK